jgi:HD-GYP domain-containing protein (c-di-GMP phosphodiesterase class II)
VKPLILASPARVSAVAALLRGAAEIEVHAAERFPDAAALDPARATVIVLDRALLAGAGARALAAAAEVAALLGAGEAGEEEPPAAWPADLLAGFIPGAARNGLATAQLRGALHQARSLAAAWASRQNEEQRSRELRDLAQVGAALSTERDPLKLLEMILSQARRVTGSDAGSIYLVERDEHDAPKALRFKLSQNDSLGGVPYSEFTVPIDHTSLAGHAAATREPMTIDDVYLLPAGVTYKLNKSFDQRTGYRTKSMLVFPLTTLRDDIVGVLQLINRKRTASAKITSEEAAANEVLSYDARAVELVGALASQAAVSLENSLLYEDIEKLFAGFVHAAVTAIESRDPTTAGHSGRVADLTVGLAGALERGGVGRYAGFTFSRDQVRELRYASLLHDFGKVGVREQVLVKAKKLYQPTLEAIHDRVGFLKQTAQLEFERQRSAFLEEHGRRGFTERDAELRARLGERLAELDRFLANVITANEPNLLAEASAVDLREFGARTFLGWDGREHPMLDTDELRLLTIPKGTLDEAERREIESHVTHTFRFLKEIPWTRELRKLPEIAFGHHEKLNGVGYPRGIKGEEIPVQTRMMTISDIFDALTASDRPYKPAVALPKAIDILRMETKGGMLDPDLVQLFVDAKVYEATVSAP